MRQFKILPLITLSCLIVWSPFVASADDPPNKSDGPTWFKPQISIYNPPPPEISTSPVFRTVDPQIIQKLINLLDETSLAKKETVDDNPTLKTLVSIVTPEGLELSSRYQYLGVALSESLGWEPVKHVRVISEQNLKQRLTQVARWDHTPLVRSIALISLAKLKDKNDLVYFKESLWTRDIGIRFASIEALKEWGFPDLSVPMLQDLMNKDESTLIRVVAADALAHLTDPQGLDTLRKDLEDKDWMIRALSARYLGDVGNADDYDLMVSELTQEQTRETNDFVTAEMAISALKLFPKKLEKERLEKEEKLRKKKRLPPPTVVKGPSKPKPSVLMELETLVVTAPRLKIPPDEMVDPQVDSSLMRMIQKNQDLRLTQDQAAKSPAYGETNQLVTPEGIQLKIRYTVLGFLLTEGLAGTKDFQLQDQLIRLAKEGQNPDVRSYALIALAYCKDQNSLGLFQEGLHKDAVPDRFAAVEALALWGFPEAVSILDGQFKLDLSPIVKVYAAQAALRLGDQIGKDYLLQAINDPDWVVRAMAMRYLGEMGNANDYDRILAKFSGEDKEIVQAEMCSALLRLYTTRKFEEEQKEDKP